MQFHCLTAGGAHGSVIQCFLGYHCKHRSAAHINTNLICIIWRQDEKKTPFLKTVSSPQKHVHINSIFGFSSYISRIVNRYLVLPASATVFSLFVCPSSSSLASVNGRLQTNYNNNVIFHTSIIWENDCSAVCVQARNRRCSKIKQNMSGRSVHLYSSV